MISNKLSLVCLILALGVASAEVDISDGVKIVVAHVKDEEGNLHEFRAPYYNSNDEPLPEEMKQFSEHVVSQVMQSGKDVIEAALIKGKNKWVLTPTLAGIGTKFYFMNMGFQRKAKQLRKKHNLPEKDDLDQKTMIFYPELIQQAKTEMAAEKNTGDDKKYKDESQRQATGRRIILIYDGIKQLVYESPVGLKLDFGEVTIDGEPMKDEVVGHIKFMSKSGLGWIIDLIGGQCNKVSEAQKEAAADDV